MLFNSARYPATKPWLNRFAKLASVLAIFALVGCANQAIEEHPEDEPKYNAEYYYNAAQKAIESNKFEQAINYFELIEARYPFGETAKNAQREIIEAYYKDGEYIAAVTAADRYIRLYPQADDLDKAYYLKGVSNYEADVSFVQRFVPVDPTKRDLGTQRQAFQDFAELISRYPQSEYAEDAKKRMVHIRNHLAQHEIHVANFYMNQQAYVAANNRARYVVENYQQTPAIPFALALQVKSYQALNLHNLAKDTFTLLQVNFPQHEETLNLAEYAGN